MRPHLAIPALGLIARLLVAQANVPDRVVNGNVIVSQPDPAVRITLPETVRYVGGDRFVLYGIADCELHALIEADANQNVRGLYWVQF